MGGGKDATLNVMWISNFIFFGLWQFGAYWGRLSQHATLSLANLRRGHIWVLLTAPFSHRDWSQGLRFAFLLASTVDSFDRAGVSFHVFLILYLGGSWAAWLGRTVIWYGIINNDPNANYMQEQGAMGGMAAQMLLVARLCPEETFAFRFAFIPLPIELTAWRTLFAHAFVDVFMSTGGVGPG